MDRHLGENSARPWIAINGLLLTGAKDRLALDMRYSLAVWNAGGMPLPITPIDEPGYIDQLLDRVDGVVLTGGDDFDTERIGLGATHPKADVTPTAKQDFDLRLTKQILNRDMPVLGVCYGMQLLGLSGGSQILQHLPEDRPGCQEHSGGVEHPIRVEKGSKLAHIMGIEPVPVISRHHQALSELLAPWVVSARDDEGLAEAIESESHRFAVGVQWHPEVPLGPESLAEHGHRHANLFRAFVAEAERAKHAHPHVTS